MRNLVYIDGALYHSEDLSDDFLAHYGVKGMKWGKRKARSDAKVMIREARRNGASRDDIRDIKRRRREAISEMRDQARDIKLARMKGARGQIDTLNRAGAIADKGLDKLNRKYENADLINDKKANERYTNEYNDMYNAAYAKAERQRAKRATESVRYRGL